MRFPCSKPRNAGTAHGANLILGCLGEEINRSYQGSVIYRFDATTRAQLSGRLQRNAFRGSGNDQSHQGIMPVNRALWAIGKLVRVRQLRASPLDRSTFRCGRLFPRFFSASLLCSARQLKGMQARHYVRAFGSKHWTLMPWRSGEILQQSEGPEGW